MQPCEHYALPRVDARLLVALAIREAHLSLPIGGGASGSLQRYIYLGTELA